MSGRSAEQFIVRLAVAFNEEGVRALARDFSDAEVEYHDDRAWPGYSSRASSLPAAARARAPEATRISCRSSMRASNASSRFAAVTA